jgi:uncharacterized protein
MQKKTIVLGASTNEERYSNMAVKKLLLYKHPIIAIGNKKGSINDVQIINQFDAQKDIDTITIYLSAANQQPYYNDILATKPKRIIFNPGAENLELALLAQNNGIETIDACTLVMLSTGQY